MKVLSSLLIFAIHSQETGNGQTIDDQLRRLKNLKKTGDECVANLVPAAKNNVVRKLYHFDRSAIRYYNKNNDDFEDIEELEPWLEFIMDFQLVDRTNNTGSPCECLWTVGRDYTNFLTFAGAGKPSKKAKQMWGKMNKRLEKSYGCDFSKMNTICQAGFTKFADDNNRCEDIDECLEGTHNCFKAADNAADAICTNNEGSFDCQCTYGMWGNGVVCTDINECEEELHDCDYHATCDNISLREGSLGYTCACNVGYEGNGQECGDIDECRLGIHICDAHADCIDIPGAYECTCQSGYVGAGWEGECQEDHCVGGFCAADCPCADGSMCNYDYETHGDCESCDFNDLETEQACYDYNFVTEKGTKECLDVCVKLSPCEREREAVSTKPFGAFVPWCKDNGDYQPYQCHHSTGYCWCAEPDGTEIPGTKKREVYITCPSG